LKNVHHIWREEKGLGNEAGLKIKFQYADLGVQIIKVTYIYSWGINYVYSYVYTENLHIVYGTSLICVYFLDCK